MATVKILRETASRTYYGVMIKNYAADQMDFKVFETDDFDKATACADAMERNNISSRIQYNACPNKSKFVKAGCEI